MKTRTLVAAGVIALVVGPCTAATVDLLFVPHGIHFVDAGHRYQVRPNSWVTRITGSDATTLGQQIHLAWPRGGRPSPSSYLICHELRHLWQRRESAENPDATPTPLFELRHLIGGPWRDSVESMATAWGMAHRGDPHCVFVATTLRDRVQTQ